MKILNSNMFTVCLYFCILLGGLSNVSAWSYSDLESWPTTYPSCSGHYQTPIDISFDSAIYAPDLGTITFTKASDFDLSTATYTVTNNGHSVQVDFGENQWKAVITPDEDTFELMQIHFHWGAENSRGSEHLIGGKRYPMETHIVTYNKRLYQTKSDGAAGPHGLAVFGIMHSLDDGIPQEQTLFGQMGEFESALTKVTQKDQTTNIPAFNVTKLLTQTDAESYYRYPGSLTTPPCTQNVMWTVFTKPVPITSTQLKLLRKLLTTGDTPIQDNYRPAQPLNDAKTPLQRKVYRSMSSAAQFKQSWWSFAAFILLVHLCY